MWWEKLQRSFLSTLRIFTLQWARDRVADLKHLETTDSLTFDEVRKSSFYSASPLFRTIRYSAFLFLTYKTRFIHGFATRLKSISLVNRLNLLYVAIRKLFILLGKSPWKKRISFKSLEILLHEVSWIFGRSFRQAPHVNWLNCRLSNTNIFIQHLHRQNVYLSRHRTYPSIWQRSFTARQVNRSTRYLVSKGESPGLRAIRGDSRLEKESVPRSIL